MSDQAHPTHPTHPAHPVQPLAEAQGRREVALERLCAWLRIPSVSTDPKHLGDLRRAAEWVAEQLRALGGREVAVLPTRGHPVVFGELGEARPGAPTLLCYGHYDVQPPEPLEAWVSGPFDPTVRGEHLYARGASDMKGQVSALLMAVEAWRRSGEQLPVRLKFLIEGEEEIGSPHLAEFIAANRDRLACDFWLNCDSGMPSSEVPALMVSLRGVCYFELQLQGARADLHSGTFGGTIPNPAHELARVMAGLHDRQGRITLPGFYDEVLPPSPAERQELARHPANERWWLEQSGAAGLLGEEGYSPVERTGVRPALDLNGLSSGWTGDGVKTVLPAKALAKFSFRIVPRQRPEQVAESLRAYLRERVHPAFRWELREQHGCRASRIDPQSRSVQAATAALRAVWGEAPLYIRSGYSVPVVGLVQDLLGVEAVLMGFELTDDGAHAPNERIHLPTYYRGIEAYIHFLNNLGYGNRT